MKRLGFLVFALAVLGLAPAAQAATLTFDLNCSVVSATQCTPHSSYGTITLKDDTTNAHWIDVTVSLNSPWDEVFNVYLNYGGTITSGYSWSLSGGGILSGATYASNDKGPYGTLDLNADTGLFGEDTPWTGTLKYSHYGTYQNLDVSMFNYLDQYGVLRAAADIGSCDTISVGSDPAPAVPEPASMTLLGTGLIGLAGAIRRRMKK